MQDWDPEGQIFLSIPHTYDGVFFLHTFHFWTWIFDYAAAWIADVRHIMMTLITVTFSNVITFSDVNLNDGIRDVPYKKCTFNTREFSFFILPWVG